MKSISEPQEVANYMHFTEIDSKLASEIPSVANTASPEYFLDRANSTFEITKIKSSEVLKLLKKVNISKATGHDKISNKILKIGAPFIYKSLTDLFNLSITTNVFPCDWKIAKVSPLFKSGERSDPNNYRSISVLPMIACLFERIVYQQMYTYCT